MNMQTYLFFKPLQQYCLRNYINPHLQQYHTKKLLTMIH